MVWRDVVVMSWREGWNGVGVMSWRGGWSDVGVKSWTEVWSDVGRVPTRSLFPGKVLTFDHWSLGPGNVLSFSNSSKRSGKSPYFLIKSRLMNRCLM